MGFILICKISRLDWMKGEEKDRHSSENFKEHFRESKERGEKMLGEIISVFPKEKKIYSLPLEKAVKEIIGDFSHRVSADFYMYENLSMFVKKVNTILNSCLEKTITDLTFVLNASCENLCKDYQEEINKIQDSYIIKKNLNKLHKFYSEID